MLKSNTIRFSTDTFGQAIEFVDEPIDIQPDDPDAPDTPEEQAFTKQALLVSKTPFNCTSKTAVDQFIITGSEPTGSKRRIIFKIDDALYRFKNGSLIAYAWDGAFDDIISHGNKVSTLAALTTIPDFVGKKIYPIIALQAPSDADEFPTIKLALATRTNNDQLVDTVETPIYEIADDAETITDISAKTALTGAGEVSITVRLRNNGSWSSYMTFENAVDEQADAVQFKIKYTVATTDGSDSAQVKSITVSHTSGSTVVTGSNANVYSTVADYDVDLQTCYVLVRHLPLIDATIDAYVNFMEPPKHRELIQIGTGTGSRQELTLGDPDSNIVASSIKIYVNDAPFFDFDFSTELSTVILTAKRNAVISASYDYDYGVEEWLHMAAEEAQPYNDDAGTYSTRFTYSLPSNATNMTVSNVRLRIRRQTGSQTESLGKATGKTQLFTLKHKAKPSTIEFTGNVDWTYDETSGILACSAAKKTALQVSYDWQGDNVEVLSFAAGWSVA